MNSQQSATADELNTILSRARARAEVDRREFKEFPLSVIRRENLLKIKTKDSRFILFKLKPIQSKLLGIIIDLWSRGIPIRIWILKARQEGVSSLVESIIYVLTAIRENVNALIISKDTDQATTLFNMSKLFHSEMRRKMPTLIYDTKKSNAKELTFEERRSGIRIETAKDATAGRGDNYQLVHWSEVAFAPNASILATGLKQAVANLPGTMFIGETTANGFGGYFYDQWQAAVNGQSDYIPLFFAWFDDPTYSRFFTSESEKAEFLKSLGTDSWYNEYEGEEQNLQENHGCSLEQLNWRRFTIRNECDGDLDTFHQEYPATPEEAFLVSGRPRFNVKILKSMMATASLPLSVGFLGLPPSQKHPDFESNSKGYLKIWVHPVAGRTYVIGGDSAKGRMVNDGKKESDSACLHVLDRHTLEQVAIWHGHIDPDLFGHEAVMLARYYNDAFLGIERNDSGLTTITRIKHENYWNVYSSEVFDEIIQREEKKLGWLTTSKSKPLMIDELARCIREHTIKINDSSTITECMTYVIDDQGHTNAQEGCHDDRVMALAISVQMARYYPDHVDQPVKAEDTYGTLEWHIKQNRLKEASRGLL